MVITTYRYIKFRMVIIEALNNIRFIIFHHVIEWHPYLPNYNHKLTFVVRHPPPHPLKSPYFIFGSLCWELPSVYDQYMSNKKHVKRVNVLLYNTFNHNLVFKLLFNCKIFQKKSFLLLILGSTGIRTRDHS